MVRAEGARERRDRFRPIVSTPRVSPRPSAAQGHGGSSFLQTSKGNHTGQRSRQSALGSSESKRFFDRPRKSLFGREVQLLVIRAILFCGRDENIFLVEAAPAEESKSFSREWKLFAA